MSIETIFRVIVQSIIISHNYSHFSQTMKSKFGFILDFIDKWNPELLIHNCSILTKIYQFYHNDKQFGKCHNNKCTTVFTDIHTFRRGYPVCCCKACRNEYYKMKFSGANNPNFGHKWNEQQRKHASENTTRQMQNPYYRYIANQPKTEEARQQKSRKISWGRKKFFEEHPEARKSTHQWTDEEKRSVGQKSKEKFTPEFNERYRQTMEQRGHWIPRDRKTDAQIYYKEANWIDRMFDFIQDTSQLDELKQRGVFNAYTNTKGVVRDHIYSRHSGFNNGVFPEILRHPCNCQILSHSKNVKKRGCRYIDRDDQTLEQLFDKILHYNGNWKEQEICIQRIQEYKCGQRWYNPYK